MAPERQIDQRAAHFQEKPVAEWCPQRRIRHANLLWHQLDGRHHSGGDVQSTANLGHRPDPEGSPASLRRRLHHYGPVSEPYTMVAYFDSDMSLFKDFHVWRHQHAEFRIEAFNWLNHPLRQFSGGGQLSLHYQAPYGAANFQPAHSFAIREATSTTLV